MEGRYYLICKLLLFKANPASNYKMSGIAAIKLQLQNTSGNTSGSHKDQADRYKTVLEAIMNGPQGDLSESIRLLVDQSKLTIFFSCSFKLLLTSVYCHFYLIQWLMRMYLWLCHV